jgi:hypothetical protein
MPSNTSTPKRERNLSNSTAGSASPAETPCRTVENASSGTPLAKVAAKNVGTPNNTVARSAAARVAISSGVDRDLSSNATAPADSGMKHEFPRP